MFHHLIFCTYFCIFFNRSDFISVYGLLTFASGSFDLTDNQLMNLMLGPQVSRPFVQSVHAFAAVGFVMGNCHSIYILGQ